MPRARGFSLIELPFDGLRIVRQDERKAFTLIELLVVVAIIALLVAILVPTLEGARRSAKVILCASNIRQYGLGLALYATANPSGNYPPHQEVPWDSIGFTVWSGTSSMYTSIWPDKHAYLDMFEELIAGGTPRILYCPFDQWYNPYNPDSHIGLLDQDPEHPGFFYSQSMNTYHVGYVRFANMQGTDFTFSGNSQTDGPPMQPGTAQDAILADVTWTEPGAGIAAFHMPVANAYGQEAVDLWQENNVAYADGHVETNRGKAYIDASGYVAWEDSHYVLRPATPHRYAY